MQILIQSIIATYPSFQLTDYLVEHVWKIISSHASNPTLYLHDDAVSRWQMLQLNHLQENENSAEEGRTNTVLLSITFVGQVIIFHPPPLRFHKRNLAWRRFDSEIQLGFLPLSSVSYSYLLFL